MKIALWVFRVLFAVYNAIGAFYMMGHASDLASAAAYQALPAVFWTVLGALQILLSIGLLVPISKNRSAAPLSAACLAIISLAGIWLYAAYAGFPGMLWGLLPAAVYALLAYRLAKP